MSQAGDSPGPDEPENEPDRGPEPEPENPGHDAPEPEGDDEMISIPVMLALGAAGLAAKKFTEKKEDAKGDAKADESSVSGYVKKAALTVVCRILKRRLGRFIPVDLVQSVIEGHIEDGDRQSLLGRLKKIVPSNSRQGSRTSGGK